MHLYDHHGSLLRERDDKSLFTGCKNVEDASEELNPQGTVFDPNCVRNLAEIIEKTGADIVVSSSWKYIMSYKDFLDLWEFRNLPGFVTDVTPTPDVRRNRGDEIDAWLYECDVECQYVIIDDLDGSNFNEHQLSRLLVVNPFNGLDEEIAERAIAILNQDV